MNKNTMYRTVQCTDGRTKEKGCFGFREKIKTPAGEYLFYSLTPVFKDIDKFYNYTNAHNITVDRSPVMYSDVPLRA